MNAVPDLSKADPRWFQILTLGGLLTYAIGVLAFDQTVANFAVLAATALLTQHICGRLSGRGRLADLLSALITALSLSLLLRTSGIGIYVLAAILAVASKFVIRIDGKHIFNPANFAIVALIMLTGEAWVSPGQWGREVILVFAFSALAALVLTRAKRLDVALTFLAVYAGLVLARAVSLGDPLAIPAQQLQSGALLLFAFFMITDPRTTPDLRAMRMAYAAAVAALAFTLQYFAYMPAGIMYALFLASPLVPVLDRMSAGERTERFQWSRPTRKVRFQCDPDLCCLLQAPPWRFGQPLHLPKPFAASTSPRLTRNSSTRLRKSSSRARKTGPS